MASQGLQANFLFRKVNGSTCRLISHSATAVLQRISKMTWRATTQHFHNMKVEHAWLCGKHCNTMQRKINGLPDFLSPSLDRVSLQRSLERLLTANNCQSGPLPNRLTPICGRLQSNLRQVLSHASCITWYTPECQPQYEKNTCVKLQTWLKVVTPPSLHGHDAEMFLLFCWRAFLSHHLMVFQAHLYL